MVQVRIPELSGEAFESVTVTALPLAPGDLGFSDDARGPSHSAVHALLGRSFSGDTEQEDEGMEASRGILQIAGSQNAGVDPTLGPGSSGLHVADEVEPQRREQGRQPRSNSKF